MGAGKAQGDGFLRRFIEVFLLVILEEGDAFLDGFDEFLFLAKKRIRPSLVVDEGVRAVEDVRVVAEQVIPEEDAGIVLLEDEQRPLDVLDGSEDRLVEG